MRSSSPLGLSPQSSALPRAAIQFASPVASNVDTVLVDGRILKRNGKLTAIDAGKLIDEASGTCPADT